MPVDVEPQSDYFQKMKLMDGSPTWSTLSTVLTALLKGLGQVMKEEYAKRDVRLDALEIRLEQTQTKAAAPGVRWAGTHEPGKPYREGELVTGRGGLWVAQKDTDTSPGMAPDAWKLILRAKTAV